MIPGAAGLAAAAVIFALLPAGMVLRNLALYRKPDLALERPAVSVLIPARNEEANIADAVGCALAATGVDVEIVVLDDGSTDRTPEILRAIADPRLRIAAGTKLPAGWSGKQFACMQLAGLATHELMVFVDADVRLAPDALSRMAGFMQQRPALGLASGFPRQITVTWSERLLLPLIMFLLLGFLPLSMMRRSLSPGFGAGCGQLFVARRDAYFRVGGHSAIRASLHDGLTLPRAFRSSEIATDLFDASSFATCRMYTTAAQVWEGLTKNATEGMAKWRALPFWTVILGGGHVLPVALLFTGAFRIGALALILSIATRLVLASWFRQPLLSALLHPLGVAALLALQWAALLRAAAGIRATWRGRSYEAQG